MQAKNLSKIIGTDYQNQVFIMWLLFTAHASYPAGLRSCPWICWTLSSSEIPKPLTVTYIKNTLKKFLEKKNPGVNPWK